MGVTAIAMETVAFDCRNSSRLGAANVGPAQPGSPLAIFSIALTLYSVYVLSKALYRKSDLKRSAEVPVLPVASSHASGLKLAAKPDTVSRFVPTRSIM